jgi:hypothetical protein
MESAVIQNMIDNIINNKQADALQDFNTAMADKISGALDVKKIEIASSIGKTTIDVEEQENENV